MPFFHLQWTSKERPERLVLADSALPWCKKPHECIEAQSWLDALSKLGYPLTARQSELLNAQRARLPA
jgi:hypothetical protein